MRQYRSQKHSGVVSEIILELIEWLLDRQGKQHEVGVSRKQVPAERGARWWARQSADDRTSGARLRRLAAAADRYHCSCGAYGLSIHDSVGLMLAAADTRLCYDTAQVPHRQISCAVERGRHSRIQNTDRVSATTELT